MAAVTGRTILALAIVVIAAVYPIAAPDRQQTPTRKPDVIFVESDDAVVDAMLKLAAVTAQDVVYDLGCGNGKIVIAAARQHGARGVGIDIDPDRIADANRAAAVAGVTSKVRFLVGDIFSRDTIFSDATVVMLFLLPSLNQKLRSRLLTELKPGTRVVSNSFDMGSDWPAEATQQVGDYTIYKWTIPRAVRYAPHP